MPRFKDGGPKPIVSGRNVYEVSFSGTARPGFEHPDDGLGIDMTRERRIYPHHPQYERLRRQMERHRASHD